MEMGLDWTCSSIESGSNLVKKKLKFIALKSKEPILEPIKNLKNSKLGLNVPF
jgi:hypothetical protein